MRIQSKDMTLYRNDFMKYIGGQSHVQCREHRLPMIWSSDRFNKCACTNQERYMCAQFDCNICICYQCFDKLNPDVISYFPTDDIVNTIDTEIESDVNSDESIISVSSTSEESSVEFSVESISEFVNDDDDNNNNNNNNNNDDDDTDDDDDDTENESISNTHNDIDDESEDDLLFGNDDNDNELDNFLTCNELPDIDFLDQEVIEDIQDAIPTTDAGDRPLEIREVSPSGQYISGHVLLNQVGCLLNRPKHLLKSYSTQKKFLQQIVSTCNDESIPLIYPEGMLFPSIFYKMLDDGSLLGAIPSSLLTHAGSQHGIASARDHITNRISLPSSTSSTDPRYLCYVYDMATNLTMCNLDTRLILNRGLNVGKGGRNTHLSNSNSNGSHLTDSIDSKQNVKNLCASQKYHPMHFFLTFTCNQKSHFGVKPIKQWLDNHEWNKFYPEFYSLSNSDKLELQVALDQSAAGLLLRNWMEIRKLFLEYLIESPTCPFSPVSSMFARDEYQGDTGNLSHIHLMLALKYEVMSRSLQDKLNDLVRASICDIVRPDEVQEFINNGLFKTVDDLDILMEDASRTLSHSCVNRRCLKRVRVEGFPDKMICKKINNLKISKDNTDHTYIALPANVSAECLKKLIGINILKATETDDDGTVTKWEALHAFWKPNRHVPPTNPNFDKNISPVNGILFAATRSMQNNQILLNCAGLNTYVCKYVGSIDEGNYVVIETDKEKGGALTTQTNFLHNTKVSSSKYSETKAIESRRDFKKISLFFIFIYLPTYLASTSPFNKT